MAEPFDQSPDGVVEVFRGDLRWQTQNSDARVLPRSIAKRVAEFEIESDETSSFLTRSLDDLIVAGRAETFLADGRDIVIGGSKKGMGSMAEVLVELELQWRSLRGTSTYRSRDISAP